MDALSPLLFEDREHWRQWLADNHATANEAWITLLKKASRRTAVSYEEAVEEALCFGWVDGKMKGGGADSYALRFSPRRPGSNWAESNRIRIQKLKREGRLTPAGLAVLPPDLR